jgi:hypothetical protein
MPGRSASCVSRQILTTDSFDRRAGRLLMVLTYMMRIRCSGLAIGVTAADFAASSPARFPNQIVAE